MFQTPDLKLTKGETVLFENLKQAKNELVMPRVIWEKYVDGQIWHLLYRPKNRHNVLIIKKKAYIITERKWFYARFKDVLKGMYCEGEQIAGEDGYYFIHLMQLENKPSPYPITNNRRLSGSYGFNQQHRRR